MDRENIEAYRKEARRMEGGRGAGRGARVGPRPALMTAEVHGTRSPRYRRPGAAFASPLPIDSFA